MPVSGAVQHVERTGGIQVDVPAQPGYLSLVRMLVHTLSQRRDLDDEAVEDLVLAVSEACGWVIGSRDHQAHPARPLQLRWSETSDSCTVEVTDTSGQMDVPELAGPDGTGEAAASREIHPDPGRAALEGDLSLPLVQSLVDEMTADEGPHGTSVRMLVRCGPWEGPTDL